jgi:hypothetical protein
MGYGKETKPSITTRIEHLSFESEGSYMDVQFHDGYVDITIGGTENEKFPVTLEEWQEINTQVIKMLKQK